MESGNAAADILTGKVNPCGKLADSIARKYEDYPSADCFGDPDANNYKEDIFVGYRYFETFAQEKVLYPFGFGLSYTTFDITFLREDKGKNGMNVRFRVTNTGSRTGKEIVQVYGEAPQGKLGKPARVLLGFAKTEELEPGVSMNVDVNIQASQLASYDDSGVTGHKSCWVLEPGEYTLYAGANVRDAEKFSSFTLKSLEVLRQLTETMAVKPENKFQRMTAKEVNGKTTCVMEDVPVATRDLKQEILASFADKSLHGTIITGDKGYKLAQVKKGKVKMDKFIAQLSPEELEALSRGEGGMDSPLGPKGNAGTIGGVTKSLRDKGIPAATTTDSPAGIRLQALCSLLPCGTLLACTWNIELVESLYHLLGGEMLDRGTDILLGPGMNIHRNPLCGRNFEYFSEDPLLSGRMAGAFVRGIQTSDDGTERGLSACPKHFCCNNQETNRIHTDARVSERALREIYLRGFEIMVQESLPKFIMTSYNKINGVWSHYNWELVTKVLRGEWGYEGCVMTDWWMRYAPSPEFPALRDNAYRVRAQVDVLMPGSKDHGSTDGANDGSLLETFGQDGGNPAEHITLGELQRTARNVLNFVMQSSAMERIRPTP
jgi:beta-glucosidase